MSELALEREVVELRARNAKFVAVLRLVVVMLKVCDVTLARRRVVDGEKKRRILRAVERSRTTLHLRVALRVLGLSATRYHSWRRDEECELDDVSSCPQTRPQQLTDDERATIKEMVCSKEYRQVPTGTLAILAQRLGNVFASTSTWHRLVRRHRWRRPRNRVHPPKPRLGIRATATDEIWHVDTIVVRLLDVSRAYLYAVIDNFSRRILAWQVSESFDPADTLAVLQQAGNPHPPPTLLADAGVENRSAAVDELIDSGVLRRVMAQTEIAFSNSLIESWWRTLKHQWLYLNTLDTVESLRRLVDFYVSEHNTQLPHSAFQGQTPDEMYRGTGKHVPEELAERRKAARAGRLATNRSVSGGICLAEDKA
ncbi:MAG: DDE-type integrase/transposase/recombinase [Planctomycetota bacterium]|nr:DDE-type integrase/transposase/recombinase [Planctomycetota bacterium]